jgi:adenylate cyclase
VRLARALLAWLGPTGRLLVGGTLLGLSLVAVGIVDFFGAVEVLELKLLDAQFARRGPRAPVTPIVIVDIGEDAFEDEDRQWPWKRRLHGQLIDAVSLGGPLAIGVDILFTDPSRHGIEDDQALGDAIERAGNVVLAAALTAVPERVLGVQVELQDLNVPTRTIRGTKGLYGPVNLELDRDAAVRRAVLVRSFRDAPVPGFASQVFRTAARHGLNVRPLPTTREVLINYRGGPFTFPTYPVQRVLDGLVPPEAFAGKIVLIGSSAPTLHDIFPAPFASRGDMPGVEINANLLETLVQGIALRRPPRAVMPLVTVMLAVLAVWAAGTLRPLPSSAVALGGVLAILVGSHLLFVLLRTWVGIVLPGLAVLLGFVITVVFNVIQEQREKRRLSRYFSPSVVRRIVRSHDDALSSERRVLTVLFSDIRGFTSMSEHMAPEQVVAFLREYLTTMTDAVFLHGGTVDKYVGYAIVALYNAPYEVSDHAARAVRTALEFQARLGPLRQKFGGALGGDLRCGVGIHTGEAVVGDLGSAQRVEYTAIGDTMNLGSRLEGLTKRFEVPIIISEATYREVKGQFRIRALGEVGVRGREEAVQAYAVLGPAGPGDGDAAAEAVAAPPATAVADRRR